MNVISPTQTPPPDSRRNDDLSSQQAIAASADVSTPVDLAALARSIADDAVTGPARYVRSVHAGHGGE